ncbi:MAG: acyl carrier protein [Candidatus Competibacteraceae bacterium]|nr:acyl carrier protein [Candidatus Competibacteraceae bacterium]MBK7983092.1 acyl carrier protein [Candidatus Competibacteraceae bacterium]MBK8898360.1 acyl carrier protein [Candidatus Competibacteraceae bacterium]MBK8962165.1 acyl carrier protein [Candidatus Competibacteraceae bacterium]MBK9951380.1 acyl carrier protein [Candidatus Competibacteraceae bacterium]
MSNDQQAILAKVIHILNEMTNDWEIDYDGEIDENVRLIEDLCFASIDIVQFVVAVEEAFQRRNLPFEKLLLKEGRYVDELYVHEVVQFLKENL